MEVLKFRLGFFIFIFIYLRKGVGIKLQIIWAQTSHPLPVFHQLFHRPASYYNAAIRKLSMWAG